VYASLNAAAWVFIYFLVPETGGRRLVDIERSLREGQRLPR
jgi:hypothetical protein